MSDAGDRKRTVADDDRFFRKHPERRYRVRRASPIEVRENQLNGGLPTLPQGHDWFVAIWTPEPGRRISLLTANRKDADTDFDERMAHRIFDILAGFVEGSHATHH